MEKLALIEIGATTTKMFVVEVIGGCYHKIIDTYTKTIRFDEDIYANNTVSELKTKEGISALRFFNTLCERLGIENQYVYATSIFVKISNHKSFFEELSKQTGLSINTFNDDELCKVVYNSLLNTVDVNKGIIIYINARSTYIINFAKRNVFNMSILPFGANSLSYMFEKESEESPEVVTRKMINFIKEEIKKLNLDFSNQEVLSFIGGGDTFLTLSALCRKLNRYPLDMDNNYYVQTEDFNKVFSMLKEFGFDKTKKISGISTDRLDIVIAGCAIIQAFNESFDITNYNIASKSLAEGILSTKVLKEACAEIAKQDVLDVSLATYKYYYKLPDSNSDYVYNLMGSLFKQLSIIHKLERQDIKALKVATQLYDYGKRVNYINHSKYVKDVIINSNLYGISQRDLVVAAFAAQSQNLDNFSLSEWVKYKNIVAEEDIEVVRKIGALIGIASGLDAAKLGRIKKLDCDILGDIIIIKVFGEEGEDLTYEKNETTKYAQNFKKVYKKIFQII